MSTDRPSATERDESDAMTGEDQPGEGTEGDSSGASETERGGQDREGGGREVVVSRELYKIVTVFSTLIAIAAVVGGFVLLDTATNRTLAAPSEVDLPLAIAGVGSIALGAAVYAFASRFRTQGMGSPNSDADRGSGDG